VFRHCRVVIPKSAPGTLLAKDAAIVAGALAWFIAHITSDRFQANHGFAEIKKERLSRRSMVNVRIVTKHNI
jgi:hypothetical protein